MKIERYKQALDGITATQEEKIMAAKNITEQFNKQKKPHLNYAKRTITVAAAVAIATCGTLTVGAACDWDYASLFNSFFSSTSEKNVQYDFSGMGKDINQSIVFENYTLNIKSLIADENCAYLLYDVIFDAGYDYSPAGFDDWDIIADGALVKPESALDVPAVLTDAQNCSEYIDFGEGRFIGKNENVYSYCSLMGFTCPLSGQRIEYTFGPLVCCDNTVSLKSDEKVKNIILPCDYKCTIDIDFDVNANTVSVAADARTDLGSWGKGKVTAVRLTPLMLTVDVADYDGFKDNFEAKAKNTDFDVMLANGGVMSSVEELGTSSEIDGSSLKLKFILTEPVDTREITAVKIGSAVIDIA